MNPSIRHHVFPSPLGDLLSCVDYQSLIENPFVALYCAYHVSHYLEKFYLRGLVYKLRLILQIICQLHAASKAEFIRATH